MHPYVSRVKKCPLLFGTASQYKTTLYDLLTRVKRNLDLDIFPITLKVDLQ